MGFDFPPARGSGTGRVLSALERGLRAIGRRLCRSHPRLRGALLRAWSGYVRAYAALTNGLHELSRGRLHVFDPYRVVRVDPDEIEHVVEYSVLPAGARDRHVFPGSKFEYAGAVRDGDWDRSTRRFEDSELYRSFEAHFERGRDWEETRFFDTTLGYVEDGVALWGCETRTDLERRCRELDALYASIRTHGYLSQRQLMEGSVDDPVADGDDRPWRVRLVNDELAVCVGRDGELLFKDGRDRLAIAKLLGLDAIPVWILVRHERWQQLRARVAADPSLCASLDERVRSHPDLDACSG